MKTIVSILGILGRQEKISYFCKMKKGEMNANENIWKSLRPETSINLSWFYRDVREFITLNLTMDI